MSSIALCSNKHFIKLGKLLISKEPGIAQNLISKYIEKEKPIETDLDKIPALFVKFCSIQNVNIEDYTGVVYKGSKSDTRRLFIASVIVMYGLPWNLCKTISTTVGQDPSTVTKIIKEVEFRYKNLDDFKIEVDGIVKLLIDK